MTFLRAAGIVLALNIAGTATAEDWSGPYMTGLLSFSVDDTTTRDSSGARIEAEPDPKGPLVGLGVGHNWQRDRLVFGLEADLTSGPSGTGEDGTDRYPMDVNWLATARGRIGYDYDAFLPYLTGGIAFAETELTDQSGGTSSSDTSNGWVAGFGFEYVHNETWTFRGEYLYGEFESDHDIGSGVETDHSLSQARYGVSYRF